MGFSVIPPFLGGGILFQRQHRRNQGGNLRALQQCVCVLSAAHTAKIVILWQLMSEVI